MILTIQCPIRVNQRSCERGKRVGKIGAEHGDGNDGSSAVRELAKLPDLPREDTGAAPNKCCRLRPLKTSKIKLTPKENQKTKPPPNHIKRDKRRRRRRRNREMESKGEGKGGYLASLDPRRCDSCKGAAALIYCRADAAYLCRGCDARAHGVASNHERVWVCEVCEQAPAVVTCKADAAALCGACDADIHSANTLAGRHERAPVVPFVEPLSDVQLKPSASAATGGGSFPVGEGANPAEGNDEETNMDAAAASWLLSSQGHTSFKSLIGAAELKSTDYFFSDVDPYLDLEYATSMDARFHQSDSVVPIHTKAASYDGGIPPLSSFQLPLGGCIELDFATSKASYTSHTTHSMSHSMSSSEVGVVPNGSVTADVNNPYPGVAGKAAEQMDRETRVMRYREKRKNRRFDKTIRYASRKAYAETRPRIKGRFAKRTEIEVEVDRIYSAAAAAAALIADSAYGVVPSF